MTPAGGGAVPPRSLARTLAFYVLLPVASLASFVGVLMGLAAAVGDRLPLELLRFFAVAAAALIVLATLAGVTEWWVRRRGLRQVLVSGLVVGAVAGLVAACALDGILAVAHPAGTLVALRRSDRVAVHMLVASGLSLAWILRGWLHARGRSSAMLWAALPFVVFAQVIGVVVAFTALDRWVR